MVVRIVADVDAGQFRWYGQQAASITYAEQGQQLIGTALGYLARYAPKGGRIALIIEWVPDMDSDEEDEYLLPPAQGLGGGQ